VNLVFILDGIKTFTNAVLYIYILFLKFTGDLSRSWLSC